MRALAVAALVALGGAPAAAAPSWDLEVELTGAPIARAVIRRSMF